MKKYFAMVLLILLGAGYYGYQELTTFTPTSAATYVVPDTGDIQVTFCPHQDCLTSFLQALQPAKESIHCALFEVRHPDIQEELLNKAKSIPVQIVTDNEYIERFNHTWVRPDTWGLMHNKFCIIDGKTVITGSMNPTLNGITKNNNNLLVINSPIVANIYETEFQELWGGTFKKGDKTKAPTIKLDQTTVEIYFCPEDDCAETVTDLLAKAQSTIHFMTFSFTHQNIANHLLLKYMDGIEVRGVMEARQVTKYSMFKQLEFQGIDVVKDGNKQNMHHKVFVVDRTCVITGSFNPTNGGDARNDENVVVICDKEIAQKFEEEFDRVYGQATT